MKELLKRINRRYKSLRSKEKNDKYKHKKKDRHSS